jgi:hypothetical protein
LKIARKGEVKQMIGGPEEDRTPDLRIANATLSQLSYRPMTNELYLKPFLKKAVDFQ